MVSDLLSPGNDAIVASDMPVFSTPSLEDATRRLPSGFEFDPSELRSDASAVPLLPERTVELSAVISYPEEQAPAIETEPEIIQPELIGSQSVVPGPSAEELSELLNSEFARLGIDPSRTVSAPPSGNENQVLDLEVTVVDPDGPGGDPPTGIELVWTEVFVGDYDQNTEVGISDLSPLGNKFGGTVTYVGDIPAGDPDDDGGTGFGTPPVAGSGADNWRLWRIDGDTNGEINIADITPIATHFAQTLTGYRIYRKGPGDANFVLMDDPANPGSGISAPRSYAIPAGETGIDPNRPVRYHFTDESMSTDGTYEYFVVPYDASSDGEGVESLHDSAEFSTTPPLEAPQASLSAAPLLGEQPLTVNFDASASSDSDGTIVQYEWDWNNDGTYDDDTGGTATNSHEFTTAGFFTTTVRVRDNDGLTDTASVNIEVQANALPTADLIATPTSGLAPLDVAFDASGSSDSDGTIVKYEWDWNGDGTYDDDTGATATNNHNYADPGNFNATVRVTDDNGGTDTDSVLIQAIDPAGSTLFDVALAGVQKQREDLNLGDFPSQVQFSGYAPYGNDTTGFDVNGSGDWNFPDEEVPGSRFGGFTNYWHDDHTALPTWATNHTDAVMAAGTLEQIVGSANDIFFEGDVRQAFFAPPTAGTDFVPAVLDPLGQAVIDLINNQGGVPNEVLILTDASDVPADVQDALARVILAADVAATARDQFLAADLYWGPSFGPYDPGTPPESNIWDIAYNTSHTFRCEGLDITYIWPLFMVGLDFDDVNSVWVATGLTYASTYAYDEMAQSALDLARAIDQAEEVLLAAVGPFDFDQDTPIGRIVINSGSGNTEYSEDEYLLICDIDGDDTYNCAAGANAGVFNSVSINIDVSGNDTYATLDDYQDANGIADDTRSQQGCGRMGVGMLIDYSGNDMYSTSTMGQGAAILGWGLLYDRSGDDSYFGIDHVQGSAHCGIGVLYDQDGTDSYETWSSSQGFGDIWGLGILTDKGSGNDTYYAEWDGTVGPDAFLWQDDPPLNLSRCQGASFGLRTTSNLPATWDGGVGMLVDDGGDDSLTCAVMGQGQGFWFSTGVCDLRGAGTNSLEGMQYVQGGAFGFSTAFMRGGSGIDNYNVNFATRGYPLVGQALSGGNNHCVTWCLDNGGTDTYVTPRIGLGTGQVNSWSYFIDMGADIDDYGLTDTAFDAQTLGRGHLSVGNDPESIEEGSPLELEISLGLFLDCGGVDVYDGAWASLENGDQAVQSAGNDRGWFRFGYAQDFPLWRLNEFGTGYDGEGESGFEL